MIRLKKRERPRSGITHYPERVWPRHRRFVRSHQCILADVPGHVCDSLPRACHYRTAANAGTALKSHDWELWPGCDAAHGEQHRGEKTFERKYGVNLQEIAAELARKSPDLKMRLAMIGAR